MKKHFAVYILANERAGVMYVGITSDLPKRVFEHKNKVVEGFTETYHVDKLVYYEMHENAEAAIRREKRLKKWNRDWKIDLINEFNPAWEDLYEKIAVFI